jgi:hypothetical protein
MNIEEFAFILMGVIIMIILYLFLGKYLEHIHVTLLPSSGTTCTKQASAYSSVFSSASWPRLAISSTRLASIKRSSSMDCCLP